MSYRFEFQVHPGETEIRLVGPGGALPTDHWATDAPASLVGGVDLAQRLDGAGSAIMEAEKLLVEHRAIARLSTREGAALGLPPVTSLVARIATRGLVTQPEFGVELEWARPNGQPVLGAERRGAWLHVGGRWERLPDPLFGIAEAVSEFADSSQDDTAARLTALAKLREVLPLATAEGTAETAGIIGSMTIAVAGAFSLDLVGTGPAARLVPIPHRSGPEADAPLLPAERQTAFAHRFDSAGQVPSVYTLGHGWFVVLETPLRRALAEVRRVNSAAPSVRRSFMANPRTFLREALGDDTDATVLESVFQPTAAYADRVIGLGLWQPRVVPWVKMASTSWFDGDPSTNKGKPRERPAETGIRIGDRDLPLDREQAKSLESQLEAALRAGQPTVTVQSGTETLEVPASREALSAVSSLYPECQPPGGDGAKPSAPEREVLIIHPHELEVGAVSSGEYTVARPSAPIGTPACLGTRLKPHQEEGLAWLQQSWIAGAPGVLLADDMGLGKTLQGLAFLAWLRDGIHAGKIERKPVLVVAPTGLLQNWRAEHDRHLTGERLGECTEAFGRGLSALKKRSAEDDRPGLDVGKLRATDWVLTTYETLRDYDRDFGEVLFNAILFDEAQKVKTPGVRITDAAKAMNAVFRVALTGTPVENRLADLWCITDTVHPAFLGDLKTFSTKYEKDLDPDRLKTLKDSLEKPFGGRPPFLQRRLKHDRLPELPAAEETTSRHAMPPVQLSAYQDAAAQARSARRGAVLEALQRLRAISLHPDRAMEASDEAFIAASGRMVGLFEQLDAIAASREAALVFVDDLDLQPRLAGIIQRRFGLSKPPMLINGTVEGRTRQQRVDAFQQGDGGFDVMILSSRAGGVGLTLTRANHVIHLSRWWNPAVEDQCNGRVHRIGQKRPVYVHLPITVLDTARPSFDVNLDALISRKRQLMRDTLLPAEANIAAETEALLQASIT